MRRIDLNELSKWSPWPERIVGLAAWHTPDRTVEMVESEYDRDKYARCLQYYLSAGDNADVESVRLFEFGSDPDRDVCISRANDLFVTTVDHARRMMHALLCDEMADAIERSSAIVELGCGYGFNLHILAQKFPGKMYRGGEYSVNAVKLAQQLFAREPSIEVHEFNFYDSSTYAFLDDLAAPVTVFTCHAVEQLQAATELFTALRERSRRIRAVFHFEPAYDLHDSSLLGLMRRRYAQMNDYNEDLVKGIREREDHIRVVTMKPDVFGLNPLNPTSAIRWEFR